MSGPGSIRGRVLDEAMLPIAGVRIQVLPKGSTTPVKTAATDEAGEFLVAGLEPGTYEVYAAREGFKDATLRVEVTPEESIAVSFSLKAQAVLRAHHESRMWGLTYGYVACAVSSAATRCTVSSSTANQTVRILVDEIASGPLETVVVELGWTPSVGFCRGSMRTDLYSPEQLSVATAGSSGEAAQRSPANPYHWDNTPNTRGPTHLLVSRTGLDAKAMHSKERTELNQGRPIRTSGFWWITHYPQPQGELGTPVDVSCLWQQKLDLWSTLFYVAPSPSPTWSLLKEKP